MNQHPADEMLTTACEYVMDATRSDAQGMVEAMPESRKKFLADQFSRILSGHVDRDGNKSITA